MKSRWLRNLLWVLPIRAMMACDPNWGYSVTVVACQTRAPIIGARVNLSSGDHVETGYTDVDGTLTGGGAAGTITVSVDKPGYVPATAGPYRREAGDDLDVTVCLMAK